MQTNPTNSVSVQSFLDLDQHGKVQATYIWLGGTRIDIRCKTKTLDAKPASVADLPEWNYDGSSTGQAPGNNSEVIIKPRAIFSDPFRRGDNILVLCDTYTPEGEALPTNSRAPAVEIFNQALDEEPWFGMEQEYTLFEKDGKTPLGWPAGLAYPRPQGPYYCSVGTENAIGRDVVEAHSR
jgi:glutamine synthetase